jgi:hypothetical protein
VALALGAFLLTAWTIPDYGLTWDEPWYFQAADLKVRWLRDLVRNLARGDVSPSLDDEVIVQHWHWDPSHVPHPPLSRILSGLSRALLAPYVDKFVAYRLPSAMLFGVLVAATYVWMTELFGRGTGLFASLALIVTPNLFGYAHFAMTDMPLTTFWFLAAFAFWRGLRSWKWSVAFGALLGCAMATKFPAFLIPIPLVLWAHLFARRAYANNVFSMVFLTPVVMVAWNPYLWHQTLPRLARFVLESSQRGYREETNFLVFFFDRHYRASGVPWYYPFVMTAVTVPETVLLLALVGVVWLVKEQDQRAALALLATNAGFILVSGLAPGGVLHDANRLMLPALPFLVGLAGGGFFAVIGWLEARIRRASPAIRHLRPKLVAVLLALALGGSAAEVVMFHPYELSYFNRLVGGIQGAYERGHEVTYMMEVLNGGFVDFLSGLLPPGAAMNASFANFMFGYYQREGRFRKDVRITDGADFDYYVLLNRPSAYLEDRVFRNTRLELLTTWEFRTVPLVLIYRPRDR